MGIPPGFEKDALREILDPHLTEILMESLDTLWSSLGSSLSLSSRHIETLARGEEGDNNDNDNTSNATPRTMRPMSLSPQIERNLSTPLMSPTVNIQEDKESKFTLSQQSLPLEKTCFEEGSVAGRSYSSFKRDSKPNPNSARRFHSAPVPQTTPDDNQQGPVDNGQHIKQNNLSKGPQININNDSDRSSISSPFSNLNIDEENTFVS